MDGAGYELCVDIEALMLMGVAVMYLSLMRYSYACEDDFWFPHQRPRA